MKRHLLIIIFFAVTFSMAAQSDKNFPAIVQRDIPGGEITRASYYGGDALWGLINGGADIYLEYGFDKLLLQEVEWKGVKFRAEFYRMTDAKSAFGIFSVSRFKCSVSDTMTKFICITPYQLQAVIGNIYISIANDKGNNEAQNLTTDLFKNILAKVKNIAFEFSSPFINKAFSDYEDKIKFMKGKLGLQNGFPMWSEIFDQYSDYEILLLPIESEKGYVYIAQIKFKSEKDMETFAAQNKPGAQNSNIKKINQVSANELLLLESDLPDAGFRKIDSLVDYK